MSDRIMGAIFGASNAARDMAYTIGHLASCI
ncbi:hypothetical protein BJQ93_04405 [Bacillus subtilis]|nr:hypothetical protein [Bacillus subtilis]